MYSRMRHSAWAGVWAGAVDCAGACGSEPADEGGIIRRLTGDR
jgi:hypothetical protein